MTAQEYAAARAAKFSQVLEKMAGKRLPNWEAADYLRRCDWTVAESWTIDGGSSMVIVLQMKDHGAVREAVRVTTTSRQFLDTIRCNRQRFKDNHDCNDSDVFNYIQASLRGKTDGDKDGHTLLKCGDIWRGAKPGCDWYNVYLAYQLRLQLLSLDRRESGGDAGLHCGSGGVGHRSAAKRAAAACWASP